MTAAAASTSKIFSLNLDDSVGAKEALHAVVVIVGSKGNGHFVA